MHFLKRRSIKYRIAWVVLIAVSAGLLLSLASSYYYDKESQRETLKQEVHVLAKIVAARSEAALSFLHEKNATETLSFLELHSSVYLACIYDQENKLFVSQSFHERHSQCPKIKFQEEQIYKSDLLEVSQPINRGRQLSGYLYLRVGLDELNHRLNQKLLVSSLFFAFSLFGAFLLSAKMQKQIYNPIAELAKVAEEITSNRNYMIRAESTQNDEIGKAVTAFNTMLSEIALDKEQMQTFTNSLAKAKEDLTQKNTSLHQALEETENAKSELAQFTTMISHELKTPIAILHSEIELMIDGFSEPSEKNLNSLLDEAKRLARLINDIFDLLVSDARGFDYNKQAFALTDVLNSTLEQLRPEFDIKHIRQEVSIPSIKEREVFIDPMRLRQVFENLFKNTLKYTDEGGVLSVTTEMRDTSISIEIQDSYPGVMSENLDKLFVPFYREEPSRNRQTGGSGLGLAIVKTIIEDHDGQIHAKASSLGGLWITITIPFSI